MKRFKMITPVLLLVSLISGCASTQVSSRHEYSGEKLARPDHIIVHDFIATPTEVSSGSALDGRYVDHREPQSAKHLQTGRELGALLAKALVSNIRDMGLNAVRASRRVKTQLGDLVIKGYFISVEEGSAQDRVLVGFGSGAAELKTVVEGYEVTNQGLRLLGSGQLASESDSKPGVLMGAASFAATGSPVGLIVGGADKLMGEEYDTETIEGVAKRTADEIADELRIKFKQQGWI